MDRQPFLAGDRLVLRPLVEADWASLWRIARDREMWAMHPMHDRWQEPVFRAFFAEALAGGGALVAIEKADGRVIGCSRFEDHRPAGEGQVEVGWTFLARQCWGTGLNACMKALMLGHAFRFVEKVVFRVGETNWRSRSALEKIGARPTGALERVAREEGEIVHLVYAIERADFERGPLAG